LGKVLTSGIKR
jgi:hypothetical protein